MSNIRDYCVYYGKGRLEDLCRFDLVVIQPTHYNREEIAFLRSRETRVLGYLSIGEDYPLKIGDRSGPGGYASWYLDHFTGEGCGINKADGKPDRHKDWGSYFVNPSDKNWQEYVIYEKMAIIVEDLNCNGAFLDAVLYPHLYPDDIKERELKPGMIEIIKRIRNRYPKSYLLVNNGWIILKEIIDYVDAIMYESFSSTFKRHEEDQMSYTTEQANRINILRGYPERSKLKVFTLDYVEERDKDLIEFTYKRAHSFGFIPSVSNIDHTGLYMVELKNGI